MGDLIESKEKMEIKKKKRLRKERIMVGLRLQELKNRVFMVLTRRSQ